MSNVGLVTEQGYAAGSFGFQEATKEEQRKLSPEEEKEKYDKAKKELRDQKK